MAGYQPTYIKAMETGLVQSRQDFILPDDAYPVLENAYVWRERIIRKQGYELLGRLRRVYDDASIGNSGASPWTFNIFSTVTPAITGEPNKEIEPGSVVININQPITTGAITNIEKASNTRVTSVGHGLSTGNIISISGVLGMTEINGGPYAITVSGANVFRLPGINSYPWGEYIGPSGTWTFVQPQLIDQGDGTLVTVPPSGVSGTINYITGDVTITGGAAAQPTTIDFNYFPGLPVMGLRSRERLNVNNEELIPFDTKYAYRFNNGWQEFLPGTPGTTWTGTDSNFFWTTNYWISSGNNKVFWATNFSGKTGDPIRYTDGTTGTNWINFAPQIDSAGNVLAQCLAMLPFRGRMLTVNTLEGTNLANSLQYPQRIRWAAIGNPFTTVSSIVTTVSANAWRDDIPGKGGFLDIPTSEDITAIGFVRDNLVIYCERSTWQLRYTGRSIAPFQIERVNSELGAESTFSAVQFDTTLVGIGDKGVIECDSFKSERIDIKIPDLVFQFNNDSNGPKRVHGIRDIQKRLAYWTYPYKPDDAGELGILGVFPNRRLVYNYENDSWAIFTDSLTTLGIFQAQDSRRWFEYNKSTDSWTNQNYSWIGRPSLFPSIVGGNQQGFVEYLDTSTTNDVSLSIYAITGNTTTPTVIRSPNHNLQTNQVIQIFDIPTGTPFATSLNNGIFNVVVTSADEFKLFLYNSETGQFDIPQLDAPASYIGGGRIAIKDNFRIVSKKFNFLEDGQNIQLGYIDVLMNATDAGAISLNVYLDYNDNSPVNISPQNVVPQTNLPDPFFNSVVPTSAPNPTGINSSKYWQRVFCAVRGNFITIEWTLSNAQMIGEEQESDVQIDSQILWMRRAGNQLPIGV